MSVYKANERTFQGLLLTLIDGIIKSDPDLSFASIFQEQNIGVTESRFSDSILASSTHSNNKIFFELKNSSWDATDETLVMDAMTKSFQNGIEYFVTGTPRQLALYQTFKENTTPLDRKLKIYNLCNLRNDNDILTPAYRNQITPTLKLFLKDLSNLVHNITDIRWDTIDKQFINKLSAYILEASAEMSLEMIPQIKKDDELKKQIRTYIKEQDIFNVSINFTDSDIYNLCQLTNYLLFLKIIFYSYLQRDVPALNLKPLSIPEDKNLLNKALRARFNDVLLFDFESIFKESVLDQFNFPNHYIHELRHNVEVIQHLKFHDINCDIIGAIYNTLIENQEQHDRGQHFTNTNEVDIINAFCINEKTKTILDSGSGAGTFLVRGYAFLKHFNKQADHSLLLERLWGIDIAPFPVLLSSMNLSLLNIKQLDNYPAIINKDFSEVHPSSSENLIFLNKTKEFTVTPVKNKKYSAVKIPYFDTCIGNPPYIRQKLIQSTISWVNLAHSEHRLKKINQQSDLYVYYLMHTAAFLKEGGRLGYVLSSSWLDVAFGKDLQKFILDRFKIIAIIDNQKVRSFETASINTIILIIEKSSSPDERSKNLVRFVRVHKDYPEILKSPSDDGEPTGKQQEENRVKNALLFAEKIESIKNDHNTKDFSVTVITQEDLEAQSTIDGKYGNGRWGAKYLRSSEIYKKIIDTAGSKLIPLSEIVDIRRGFTTGSNDFFYLIDDTKKIDLLTDEQYLLNFGASRSKHKINWDKFAWCYSNLTKNHHLIERIYLKPLFKTQKEAKNLEVDIDLLKYKVLICNEAYRTLKKYKTYVAKYIDIAQKDFDIQYNPTNAQRLSDDPNNEREWFNLGTDIFIGDFIFPSKIGERFRLIDNRKTQVYCDKVNYNIRVRDDYKEYSDTIFLILNSTLFRYFVDLFARQMVIKVSDVDVNVVENTLIVHPKLLHKFEKELKKILSSLTSREQLTIYEEIKMRDRFILDSIIMDIIGLNDKDVKELHKQSCEYVKNRQLHADSLNTRKSKQKLDYATSLRLMNERFPEIRTYKHLLNDCKIKPFVIPDLTAKFPKSAHLSESNLFNSYNIYFPDGNKQYSVSFQNSSQVKLFQFFHVFLEIRGMHLDLPENPDVCERIVKELVKDYKASFSQIQASLKSLRSPANPVSIYRDLIFNQ